MSTLKVNSIGKTTGTTQDTMEGIIKAWGNFDGDAGSVVFFDSFNCASITDNGSGDYTVTLTNAMGDTNYGFVFGKEEAFSSGGPTYVPNGGTKTATQLQIVTAYHTNSVGDNPQTTFAYLGELA